MSMRVKSMRCKTCDCKVNNPTAATVELMWNQCWRKNCGLGGNISLPEDKSESLVKYAKGAIAWLFNAKKQTIKIFHEEPVYDRFKGSFKIPKS